MSQPPVAAPATYAYPAEFTARNRISFCYSKVSRVTYARFSRKLRVEWRHCKPRNQDELHPSPASGDFFVPRKSNPHPGNCRVIQC
jgi:hypothetical protein